MSSLIRPLEDIASCEIPYWLPPGGRDNGVWADMWVLVGDLEPDDASEALDLLAKADVGGYAAIRAGAEPTGQGPVCCCLWVDACNTAAPRTMLMRFLRDTAASWARRLDTRCASSGVCR